MTKFSLKRGITDYAKVQALIARIIRGKKMFSKIRKAEELQYLDIGCGPNINPDFVNLDYQWKPNIDVVWDITKKELPFAPDTFKGIFTEHCFEHIPLEDFKKNAKIIFRILKPGVTFRFIVPDGELYLGVYNRKINGENVSMPYEEGYMSPMHRINGIFRNHGHLFIYDFQTVSLILEEAGFRDIKKEKYNSGRDAKLLKDTEWRSIESLYVEASK